MNFEWHLPISVIFGPGTLARLPEALLELGAKRVLLVMGSGALAGAGVRDRALSLLKDFEVKLHEGVRVNLPLEDCDALIQSAREFKPEAVIGLGGGSVLDGAKAAAWLAPQAGTTEEHVAASGAGLKPVATDLKPGPSIPFLAVPTTAGTGSEATPSIILLDERNKRKVSLSARSAMARVAIVDPELTLSLPPDQTAATGLDALSHGFEAYWSKNASPLSDLLALAAISTVVSALPVAHQSPHDLAARTAMCYGALTAGMALAHTATAAVHGLTYPLTARYGVPHGIACAFLLGEVFNVNFHHLAPEKKVQLLHHLKSNTLSAALELLSELCGSLGVPETLTDLGVPDREIHRFIAEASPGNLDRNLAPLSREKILELWNKKKAR